MMMRSRAVQIVLQRGRGRRGFGGGRGADGRFTRYAVGIDDGGSNSNNPRFYNNFGVRNNNGKDDRDEKMTEIGELIGDDVRVVVGGTEEYANGSGGIRFGRRGGGTSTTSTTRPRFFKTSSSPCFSSSPSLSYSHRFLPWTTIETTRGAAASRLYHGGTLAAQQEGKKNAGGGGGGENNKGGAGDGDNGTRTPSLEFAHYERRQSRWCDTDGYGHVNNSVYYAYMDDAICVHNVRNGVGAEYPRFVVENGMKFYEPLSFPHVVGIRVVHLGSSSVTYDVGIYGVAADDDGGGGEKEEEERFLAARGKFVHVYLDDKNYRPAPIPQKVRDVLQTLVMNDGDDN